MNRIALAAALLITSCGVTAPAADFVVPLRDSGFGRHALHVYDASGIVTGGGVLEQPPGANVPGALASPERQEVQISWLGGACAHRPTLHVSGDSGSLRLVVNNPTEPQLPFVACPSVGIPFTVALSVSEPVDQAAVTLEVTWVTTDSP